MTSDDVMPFIRDESHAADVLVAMRKKQLAVARKAYVPDCPRAAARLLAASLSLNDAYAVRDRLRTGE